MSYTNSAAWIEAATARLTVKEAPYTAPKEDQIVVQAHAIAVNPIDRLMQDYGPVISPKRPYPTILGSDVAGQVVEIGSQITRFKVGDRVCGHALPTLDRTNVDNAQAAFQTYVVLASHMTVKIPDHVTYESASVIPLGLSTAACGLFQEDQLALQYPTINAKPTGKTLLIWGGSTSVGCNAIQLAVAAGYEVVTTASPHNFEYLQSLGAAKVFDYRSKTVVRDIIEAFKTGKKTIAGALSMGSGAADACMEILRKVEGNKVLAMASYPMPDPMPTSFVLLRVLMTFVPWSIVHFLRCKVTGISSKMIFGSTLATNGVGKAVYEDFLEVALAEGKFVPAPKPLIVGTGLDSVQEAFDVQKKGVSAKKVVVTL